MSLVGFPGEQEMQSFGVGLIGTGFMGKSHALAYRNARAVLGGDLPAARLELLCDTPAEKAAAMADQFGFARATDDWRALVADPAVDIVCITTPNKLHREMALAAIAAGKHVHCEKPLSLTLEEAEEMAAAARQAGVRTMVGYNYVHNPAFAHARRLIETGSIGRIVHVRGWVDEDYQADPDLPWTWRATLADAGLGTLGDLGCHLVSMVSRLAGPVESLIADMATVHRTRPTMAGDERRPVENEDVAAALVRFHSGATGVYATSRSAWGRKNSLGFEIHGTHGMLTFDQERLNELRLFRNTGDPSSDGFVTILTGPAHPPYGAFCPAAGHQIGLNDLKTIEVGAFLAELAGGPIIGPDFAEALTFEHVIHAIARSAREDCRIILA
jgi:predicted dehydrogenase